MGKKKMAIDISPATPSQVVLKLASKNQEALQKVSMQIASNNKHEDFKGFAEDSTTEIFLNFKTTISEIGAHINANNSAISRVKTMDLSISQIQGLASELSGIITQRRNSASGSSMPIDTQVKGILDKIAGALNVNFDGRFLFAGSKTNTMPVTNINTSNLDGNNIPIDSYYNGNNDIVSVRSSNSEEIAYGLNANDPAFKDLIGAAHLVIEGHLADDDTILSQAMDMVSTAITELASARANVLSSKERMTKSNTNHTDFQLLIQGNLTKVSQTDIVQATSEMSALTAIVQAGYMAFSKMSNLRLTDYL